MAKLTASEWNRRVKLADGIVYVDNVPTALKGYQEEVESYIDGTSDDTSRS